MPGRNPIGTLQIAIEDNPAQADLDRLQQGLIEHAVQVRIEPRNYRPLAVFARDEAGTVIGGLHGATVWGWLQVKELWVAAPHRRRGYGARLLDTAEREARRRGCGHAFLDTFDFQARAFYESVGYEVFGALEGFPRGHARFFMMKSFDVPAGSPAA